MSWDTWAWLRACAGGLDALIRVCPPPKQERYDQHELEHQEVKSRSYCNHARCLTIGMVQLQYQALPHPAIKNEHLRDLARTHAHVNMNAEEL